MATAAKDTKMIVVLKSTADKSQLQCIERALEELGLETQTIKSAETTMVVVLNEARNLPSHSISRLDGVEKIMRVSPRCPIAMTGGNVGVKVGGTNTESSVLIGGGSAPVIMAGPCSVESEEHIRSMARQVKDAGATVMRGGAFKPRTNPYDFMGLGFDGLKFLSEAATSAGLPVVSEILSAQQVEAAEPFVDMFQIGARNMYNYELLKEVGRTSKPVLLKRAMSATVDEFLQAAEYILLEGNLQVVLCERGIRSFETRLRNTLDLSVVPLLKSLTQLPIVVDPSHGTGRRDMIIPMSRAAIACGADGLIIEVHDNPTCSITDAAQAINPQELSQIAADSANIWNLLKPAATPSGSMSVPRALAGRSL